METKKITGADLCTGGIVRVSLTGQGPGGFGEYELGQGERLFDAVVGLTDYLTAHRFCVLMEAHGRNGLRVPGGHGYLKWTPQMHKEIDPDESGSLDKSIYALSEVTMRMWYADGECVVDPLTNRYGLITKGVDVVRRNVYLPQVVQTAAEAVSDATD